MQITTRNRKGRALRCGVDVREDSKGPDMQDSACDPFEHVLAPVPSGAVGLLAVALDNLAGMPGLA